MPQEQNRNRYAKQKKKRVAKHKHTLTHCKDLPTNSIKIVYAQLLVTGFFNTQNDSPSL